MNVIGHDGNPSQDWWMKMLSCMKHVTGARSEKSEQIIFLTHIRLLSAMTGRFLRVLKTKRESKSLLLLIFKDFLLFTNFANLENAVFPTHDSENTGNDFLIIQAWLEVQSTNVYFFHVAYFDTICMREHVSIFINLILYLYFVLEIITFQK